MVTTHEPFLPQLQVLVRVALQLAAAQQNKDYRCQLQSKTAELETSETTRSFFLGRQQLIMRTATITTCAASETVRKHKERPELSK